MEFSDHGNFWPDLIVLIPDNSSNGIGDILKPISEAWDEHLLKYGIVLPHPSCADRGYNNIAVHRHQPKNWFDLFLDGQNQTAI